MPRPGVSPPVSAGERGARSSERGGKPMTKINGGSSGRRGVRPHRTVRGPGRPQIFQQDLHWTTLHHEQPQLAGH